MDDALKEKLIDNYNELLVSIQTNDIKKLEFGFITNECNSMLLSILIHCVENINIFNDTQLNNIFSFINKLGYGR